MPDCRGKMAASVALAVVSVAGALCRIWESINPAAVCGASGGPGGHPAVVWGVPGSYAVKVAGYALSTMLAHVSAYTILEAFASRWQISS